MTNGTPKTLKEAIENGIEAAADRSDQAAAIQLHVIDFLNQKAATGLMCLEYIDAPKMTRDVFTRMLKEMGIKVNQ